MEPKTKYQFSYFIQHYEIKEENYEKYIYGLLNKKDCKVHYFEKERDLDIYSYFLPNMRDFLFPTFHYDKKKIRELESMNKNLQAAILAKLPCITFEYEIKQLPQGKMGEENGIFFKIDKIQMVCFATGVCFVVIKTNLENSDYFSDVLNFNYKFRDITSDFSGLKEYENIKIQTDTMQDVKELSNFISDITGKKEDIHRFFTYSYVCIDSEEWNEKKDFKNIENWFLKYSYILPSSYNSDFNDTKEKLKIMDNFKFSRYGMNKMGVMYMNSNIEPINYTKIPFAFENEYLYTTLLCLYQKIYMRKLIDETIKTKDIIHIQKKFTDFTKTVWAREITNEDFGSEFYKNLKEVLEIEELYVELKDKYDVLYKDLEIDKNNKINRVLIVVLVLSLLFNIVNFLILWFGK